MWPKYLVLALLLSLSSFRINAQAPVAKETVASDTEVRAFEGDRGWGYDIYMKGKKYIHQTTIPSVPGMNGFASKEDAEKVGALVIEKIEKGIMPPSVTPEELKELGINTKNSSSSR